MAASILRLLFLVSAAWLFFAGDARAHQGGKATYIANEAVMVSQGETRILFDPLPLSGFGTYPDVPTEIVDKMMDGAEPFDGIDAVFVSHAHRDHFDAEKMNAFLAAQSDTQLIAPMQAVEMMRGGEAWQDDFDRRITAIDLDFGDAPQVFAIGGIQVSAVRIPHAGWPQRADVQNIVFRVTLPDAATVMHMGDADINMAHYAPYQAHWDSALTDLAFPPYWIYLYPDGEQILEALNTKQSVGIHVPIHVPYELRVSGNDYFATSGETRIIEPIQNEPCQAITHDGAKYTVCTASAKSDIRLFWGEDSETPFADFETLETHLNEKGKTLSFAMNGGMYHPDRRPVGLYLEEDLQLQKLHLGPSTGNFGLLPNGVFYTGKNGAGIMRSETFAIKELDLSYATQSGPMLVIDGALHPRFKQESKSRKIRNGVGVSPDRQTIYFVISDEPVNFHSFASLFKNHLETPNALYLDGVVSRLYDPAGGRHDPGMPLGPIVGVVEDLPSTD